MKVVIPTLDQVKEQATQFGGFLVRNRVDLLTLAGAVIVCEAIDDVADAAELNAALNVMTAIDNGVI